MSSDMSIRAEGGLYVFTDSQGNTQKADLASLMMMLSIEQTKAYDDQLAVRMSEMKERSHNMKQMTEALNLLRVEKGKSSEGGRSAQRVFEAENMLESAGLKLSPRLTKCTNSARSEGGWETTDGGDHASALEAQIEYVKSSLEAMGNDSQLENIKLQNLMQKRGNTFEMTTKIMDSNNQTIQSIIRNL